MRIVDAASDTDVTCRVCQWWAMVVSTRRLAAARVDATRDGASGSAVARAPWLRACAASAKYPPPGMNEGVLRYPCPQTLTYNIYISRYYYMY